MSKSLFVKLMIILALLVLIFSCATAPLSKPVMSPDVKFIDEPIEKPNAVQGYYEYKGVFAGGVLMYRPEGTQRLDVFDLNNAEVILIKRGPPANCIELVILGNDGRIEGGCQQLLTP